MTGVLIRDEHTQEEKSHMNLEAMTEVVQRQDREGWRLLANTRNVGKGVDRILPYSLSEEAWP